MFRFLFIVGFFVIASAARGADTAMVIHSVKGQFEDIKNNVVFAIENRGLVINTVAHVGEMLERTGRDLGAAKQIYLHAEVLEFCSAKVSRGVMEVDPHSIVFCPYTVAVYELAQEPGKIYVSYRKPALARPGRAAKALGSVEQLLRDIVREALQ